MNCQNFENVINELARDQIIDAFAREQAIAHFGQCAHCSLRLNEELKLTERLRELSSQARAVIIPDTIEGRLLAEFRVNTVRDVSKRLHWRYAYAAAAAVLLVAVSIAAIRSRQQTPVTSPTKEVAVVATGAHAAGREKPKPPRDVQKPAPKENTKQQFKRKTKPVRVRDIRPLEAVATVSSPPRTLNNSEVATEFMALGYSNVLNLQEGGQVVRVELPRYAMARFGLPVNMDRYEERVKADVLMGVDGLARAIRFVQ